MNTEAFRRTVALRYLDLKETSPGISISEFASSMGVSHRSVYLWVHKYYPEEYTKLSEKHHKNTYLSKYKQKSLARKFLSAPEELRDEIALRASISRRLIEAWARKYFPRGVQ